MIKSFKSKDTEDLFRLLKCKRWASIERVALRKLVQLDLATTINDMRIPPGNQLEMLAGDRKGQWSVRINDQFRLCFSWAEEGPEDVEIVDYH